MIEVNLLPGGGKRQGRGGGWSFTLPSFGGGGGALGDRWVLSAVVACAVALGALAWFYVSLGARSEDVEVALEAAVQDSVRFADLIERANLLEARSDSISQKVSIIQEIDEGRYVWPHVLDEVSRAIPDYTWLTAVTQVSEPGPRVRIEGQTGNNFALAVFMEELEASPFIRGVRLIQSEQVVQTDSRQVVVAFQVEADYVQPPFELLQTVPLFGADAPGVPPMNPSEQP